MISGEIVAIDGKAQRRARNKNANLHYIVNAWAGENRLLLGQYKVSEKSNEITAIPDLLRILELSGCIITCDAMGRQKNIAKEIIEADADYVLALKGNHETAHGEISTYLLDLVVEKETPRAPGAAPANEAARLLESWSEVEKDHGRTTTRHYHQSDRTSDGSRKKRSGKDSEHSGWCKPSSSRTERSLRRNAITCAASGWM